MIDNIINSKIELENTFLVSEDSPILKKKLKPFDFNGDIDPKKLIATMTAHLLKHKGLGISANQIGIDARVFIIGLSGVFIEVFNPQIINYTGRDILYPEGCISFPNMFLNVRRPGAIHVKFQTLDGKYREELYSGLTARIFLHEYDHLEGITFKDKVSKMKWNLAEKRKVKLLSKYKEKI